MEKSSRQFSKHNADARRETASSEMVSSLALILVLITVAGAVLSFLAGSYPQEKVPYADIQVQNITQAGDEYTLFTHKGGESFSNDSIRIRVIKDGTTREYDKNSLELILPNGSEEIWAFTSDDYSYGYGLRVPKDMGEGEYSYQILYQEGGGDYVYRQYGKGARIEDEPTPVIPCDPSGLDAGFAITYDCRTYTFTASDTNTSVIHGWAVSGPDYIQTFSGNPVMVTLPENNSGGDEGYIIHHWVANSTNPSCMVSESQTETVSSNPTICTADFSYRSEDMNVFFTDQSQGADAWNWTFGDGETGEGQSPYHQYSGKTSYPVSLVTNCTDDCGEIIHSMVTKQISVGCSADSSFSADYIKTTSNPWNVTFTRNYGGEFHTIIWDFGDGIQSTEETGTVIHSYQKCGEFTVTLQIVTDNCGAFSSTNTIQIPCICNSPPTASFTIDNIQTGYPFIIRITDSSLFASGKSLIRWDWDLGDGTRFTNITAPGTLDHSYQSCGKYPVHLVVYDSEACFGEAIREASCGGDSCTPGIPNARFSYTQSLSNPRSFTFTDQSTPTDQISRWKWNFGDGSSSTEQNPTHEYSSCTQNTVQLRVWDKNNCWDDTILDVSCPCPKPEARFTVSQDPTDKQQFTFTDSSNLPTSHLNNPSYYWEFGDGQTSTLKNPSHRYDTCSQYTVRLTVTTDCGSSDDAYQDAVCGCPLPVASFDYRCLNETSINLTDTSRSSSSPIKSWYWEFGDDTQFTGQLPPNHQYASSGTYQVNLTVENDCGQQTWSRDITVPCCRIPTAGFTYQCLSDGRTIRFNDTSKGYGRAITSWDWNFGDGSSSTEQNPEHSYSTDGTRPVSLTVTTDCYSKNTWQSQITTPCFCSPPQAGYETEVLSVDPFTVRFNDTSSPIQGELTSRIWNFGDGNITTLESKENITHTYDGCGEYLAQLEVINSCGGRDDSESLICCPVHAGFTYLMDQTDGRAPVNVTFTDTTTGTPTAWYWNFGDGAFSSDQSPSHIYTKEGNYTVTLHATNTCGGDEVEAQLALVTCPPVQASFTYEMVSQDPLTIQFIDTSTGYDITKWNWYFDDGTSSTEQSPVHTYTTISDYEVILKIKNSCGSESIISKYLPIGCPPLTIIARAEEGGTIDPEGNVTVPCEYSQSFNITADPCYDIADIVINEFNHLGPQESPYTYTFYNLQTDQTITAYFQIKEFHITSSAGSGGTIDPLGIIPVYCGENFNFTIAADTCFEIAHVLINGTLDLGRQTSPYTYTFENITSDQSIHAEFTTKYFNLTTAAYPPEGGTIDPAGPLSVLCHASQTFTIEPEHCYDLTDVRVNRTLLCSGSGCSVPYSVYLTDIQNDHLIEANFTLRGPYYINATAFRLTTSDDIYDIYQPLSGGISPIGIIEVPCGQNQYFTMGYPGLILTDVLVDGVSMGPIDPSNPYFTDITSNHTISAIYSTQCERFEGYILDRTTYNPIQNIRVKLTNEDGSNPRYRYSNSNGYFVFPVPISNAKWMDIYCQNSPIWVTTAWTVCYRDGTGYKLCYSSKPSDDPTFVNNVHMNNGAKCDPVVWFYGYLRTINPADFILNAPGKTAYIREGSEISFVIEEPILANSYITVEGARSDFTAGDSIRLVNRQNQYGGNGIYMGLVGSYHTLSTFDFDSVYVYKNGVRIASGSVDSINIPNLSGLSSSLALVMPDNQNIWIYFQWGLESIINGVDDFGLTINNLTPDSSGVLNVNLGTLYAQGHSSHYTSP